MDSSKGGSTSERAPSPSIPNKRDWPAPASQLAAARTFLRECAAANAPTLLLPDKDADGLCSGLIVHHTLLHLGLAPARLSAHFPAKGANIHAPAERAAIAHRAAHFVVITDQGSRAGPPIAPPPARTLVIDHHWSTEFPQDAVVCSAAQCPPVATSATLAHAICVPLLGESADAALKEKLDYLCAMGTMGDLGTSFKWEPPFPDMRECFKKWTKKVLGEAVALLNAPRRTAEYDVSSAWRALLDASSPRALVDHTSSKDVRRLFEARAEVKSEVDRCARRPPTFSGDANGEGGTDIIAILKEYASRVPGLRESMGDDFARGHKQASGGIVRTEDFEKLWDVMLHAEREDGEPPTKKRKSAAATPQKNTLEGWLKKP